MPANLTITLPKETRVADLKALEAEIQGLENVKGAGVFEAMGGPLDDVTIWVKIASMAVPIVLQLIDALRKRRIEKAVVTLPNGAKIEVDKASAEEIERLMRAAAAAQAAQP